MRTGTQFGAALLSNFLIIAYSQYYADNQFYYYPQQQQQAYWPPQQQLQQPQQRFSNYPAPAPPQHQRYSLVVHHKGQGGGTVPHVIIPPLQQQQQQARAQPQPHTQYIPEKKSSIVGQQQSRIVSANTFEFDLPPPPPSRFLPDEERTKVLSTNKQGRPEHETAQQHQHRVHLVTGATNQTRQPAASPQVQVHHLQVPRILQKVASPTPSQITHFILDTDTTTAPSPPPQTVPPFTQTRLAPTTTTVATLWPIEEETRFEQEILATTTTVETTRATSSHLSPTRAGGHKVNVNKIFLQCCKEKKVAKTCESRCNFDNINKKVVTAMFLGTDPCPQAHGLDLFACAAQENDHTTCCRAKNVQRTSAKDKCLAFCNLRPDSRFQADASYLPCWAVLSDVKNCFKEAIISGGPL